ncbi:MAG: hypothetical protein K0S41_3345 [Anaerocolumna sp.]|jgi:hypothetical protein|nr:hypothetical protein [Anaerocolumna sp.]
MDPISLYAAYNSSQPMGMGSMIFIPGIFNSFSDEEEFMNSLDSDTRDYVIKHKDEFRSRDDIMNFVNQNHGDSYR